MNNDSTASVVRERGAHRYRTELPNIIDEMGLTPHGYRLYGHLKRVAGEGGECYQTVRTMAEKCNMSKTTVVRAKAELSTLKLVEITPGESRTQPDIITITDVWDLNEKHFGEGGEGRVPKQGTRTKNNPVAYQNRERDVYQNREPKKEPVVKKEPIKKEREKLEENLRYLDEKTCLCVETLLLIENWDKDRAKTIELVSSTMATYPDLDVIHTAKSLAYKTKTGAVGPYKKPSRTFANWALSDEERRRNGGNGYATGYQPKPEKGQDNSIYNAVLQGGG